VRVETGLLDLETDRYAGKGQAAASIERFVSAARAIEALGFDGATMPEAGYDPFLPLMVAAEHTQRIRLATNVAIAFPRSPMVVAQLAWDLQKFSHGRFQLGLGTQVKGHNERRYGAPWTAPPGPRLREYLLCLKAIFASFQDGKRPTYFEGKHYQFTLLPPFFNPGPSPHPHVPIYIAAVNPYMCRLAGELCDGLRLHPIATFAYTKDVVLPTIETARAKRAGNCRISTSSGLRFSPSAATTPRSKQRRTTSGSGLRSTPLPAPIIRFWSSTAGPMPVASSIDCPLKASGRKWRA